jgi:hypothetical protein
MPVRHRLGSSTLDTGAAIVRSDPPPVTAGRFSIRQLKPRYVGAFCLPTHQLEPQQRPRGSGAREEPIQTLKCRRVDRRWPGPAVPDEVLATTGLGRSARQMSASVFHPSSGRPDCVAGHAGFEVRRETGKE